MEESSRKEEGGRRKQAREMHRHIERESYKSQVAEERREMREMREVKHKAVSH